MLGADRDAWERIVAARVVALATQIAECPQYSAYAAAADTGAGTSSAPGGVWDPGLKSPLPRHPPAALTARDPDSSPMPSQEPRHAETYISVVSARTMKA